MADIYLSHEKPEKKEITKTAKRIEPAVKPSMATKEPKLMAKPLAAAKAAKIKEKREQKSINELIGRGHRLPLGAFVARPRNMNFESQGREEKIILLLRRHWITNMRWIFSAIGLALAPLLLTVFPLLGSFPPRLQAAALMLWYLLVLAFTIQQLLSWFFNVGIVTNKRVVDIDFFNLIHKRISDAELDRVQDVTFTVSGILRTMFNFGTVFIQTAAEKPELSFEDVPNPSLVTKVLEKIVRMKKQ